MVRICNRRSALLTDFLGIRSYSGSPELIHLAFLRLHTHWWSTPYFLIYRSPGNHNSTLCFPEFDSFGYFRQVESCSVCPSVTDFPLPSDSATLDHGIKEVVRQEFGLPRPRGTWTVIDGGVGFSIPLGSGHHSLLKQPSQRANGQWMVLADQWFCHDTRVSEP